MADEIHRVHRLRLTSRMRRGAGIVWLLVLFGANLVLLTTLAASLAPYRFRTSLFHPPTVIYDDSGDKLAEFTDKYRVPVALDEVPEETIFAMLAAEDTRFYEHNGLDWRGVVRAAWANVRHGRITQGGSTITMQLVRLELLTDRRTFLRKWREAVLALRVERVQTKDEILERYLNSVYFGGGAYGIEAAARSYFDKPTRELTVAESALLAGLIRAPSAMNPRYHRETAMERQKQVLVAMRDNDWLTEEEYERAERARVRIHRRKERELAWNAPYVVEMVRQELSKTYDREMLYHGGMEVYTTINADMQQAADRAMRHAFAAGRGRRIDAGALVALDVHTGDIKALVGGPDFYRTPFNRAVDAHRQPGSSFKPFVYLAAIRKGHRWSEQVLDAPISVGRWSPKNYSDKYHGQVTLQRALALSLNSVAVRLIMQVGPGSVIKAAKDAGITSRLGSDLSLALGAYEVTPLEMARAFSTFANGGKNVEPRLITEVRRGERVVIKNDPEVHQSINPGHAFLLTQGLTHVITEGTGRGANIGRPAAGKTGTSNSHRDAWFVGYTPDLCAAVWMGNDNRRPMAGVAGGSLPAMAWASFMRSAMTHYHYRAFPVPNEVAMVPIDPRTGAVAGRHCPNPKYTYVMRGRAPLRQPTSPPRRQYRHIPSYEPSPGYTPPPHADHKAPPWKTRLRKPRAMDEDTDTAPRPPDAHTAPDFPPTPQPPQTPRTDPAPPPQRPEALEHPLPAAPPEAAPAPQPAPTETRPRPSPVPAERRPRPSPAPSPEPPPPAAEGLSEP